MADKDKNVNVTDPTSSEKSATESYAQSDVEHVMRVKDFTDWGEVISWLKSDGDRDNELTPGEVKAMVNDFSKAQQGGAQFTPGQPDKIYATAHGSG